AIVKLDDFGKVALLTGASEIGQGSETVLAMIVAETLGVPLERVDVVNSDTSVRPWDVGTHASRTTFVAGNAARLAAERVKGERLEVAAVELEEPAERLDVAGGVVFVRSEPHRRLPYEQVARAGHFRRGGRVLVAEAFYDPPTVMLDKDFQGNVSAAYASACQAVVVDVEPETGKIEVHKIVSAHDVGRALNPGAAEGQVHGGIHMGLGYALTEKLVVEEGQILTQSFMDYAVFKAADMPEIVVRLIETVDAEGPFGAKGLGEAGVIPVGAAGADALEGELGARFSEVPVTAARRRLQGSTSTAAYALEGRTSSSPRDWPTAATAAAWYGSRASRNAMTMLASRTTIATRGAISVGIPLDTLPSGGRRSRPASPQPG